MSARAEQALDVIAARFTLTDSATGEVVWRPTGTVEALVAAIDAWLHPPTPRPVINPADPLSYLLADCTCRPRALVKCAVHGVARGRPDFRVRHRHRQVVEHYRRSGSLTETGRAFGVSYQRVQQILAAGAAPAGETKGRP